MGREAVIEAKESIGNRHAAMIWFLLNVFSGGTELELQGGIGAEVTAATYS